MLFPLNTRFCHPLVAVPPTCRISRHKRRLFGVDWSCYEGRMTISGFARKDGKWAERSGTFNCNMAARHMVAGKGRAMSSFEGGLVFRLVDNFLSTGQQTFVVCEECARRLVACAEKAEAAAAHGVSVSDDWMNSLSC
jgi:hypothetical protein